MDTLQDEEEVVVTKKKKKAVTSGGKQQCLMWHKTTHVETSASNLGHNFTHSLHQMPVRSSTAALCVCHPATHTRVFWKQHGAGPQKLKNLQNTAWYIRM